MFQPESVKRQAEEAQRIHEAVYQIPGEEPAPEPQKDEQPDASGQVHDWKLRFTNYKASADREISTLRHGVGQLQAQVQALAGQLEEARKQTQQQQAVVVPPDLLSDSEKDMLGEENLAIVAKVADAKAKGQIAELQGTIKRLEEQLSFYAGREHKRDQMAAAATLQERLTAAYPSWQKVDQDPAFELWMREVDPLTGRPRDHFFKVAHQAGDVSRLAAFYREYGEKRGADPREAMVMPNSRPSAEAPPAKGKTWARSEIAEFYERVRRGEYNAKPQEKAALEADIFAAQREGRVR